MWASALPLSMGSSSSCSGEISCGLVNHCCSLTCFWASPKRVTSSSDPLKICVLIKSPFSLLSVSPQRDAPDPSTSLWLALDHLHQLFVCPVMRSPELDRPLWMCFSKAKGQDPHPDLLAMLFPMHPRIPLVLRGIPPQVQDPTFALVEPH